MSAEEEAHEEASEAEELHQGEDLGLLYEVKTLRKPQHVADMGRDITELHYVFGTDYFRRDNFAFIEDDVIVYTVANAVVFENILMAKKEYILGIDENGVGCVAVHPSRKRFAVGGVGFQPRIFIYGYPDMTIRKVLTGGVERGYANLNFNHSGSMLASLGTSPDYMLTVWDWEKEKVSLKCKAFGQDIFMVRFSEDDERRLTTCGTGHIRFWKMAATFTGLKLQGQIGKFGKVELSDVAAFVELPDGKVVSGTESGALLLWEGHFIKCRFVQVGGYPCHDADVTLVKLDRQERCVITAGMDGYIRWWDFDAMDGAEVDSDVTMDYELQAIGSFYIGEDVGIRSMLDGGMVGENRTFIVQDSKGNVRSITFPLTTPASFQPLDGEAHPGAVMQLSNVVFAMRAHPEIITPINRIVSCSHAGIVTGMDTSPIHYRAATGGADGTLRVWDFFVRGSVTSRQFEQPISVVRWVPLSLDPSGNSVLVGFSDGIMRVFSISHDSVGNTVLKREMAFKPHNAPVTDAVFNQENILATSGKDGIVFFFNCNELNGPENSWTPLKFVTVSTDRSKGVIHGERLSWSSGSDILLSCTDGMLREFTVGSLFRVNVYQQDQPSDAVNASESYEAFVPNRDYCALTQQQAAASLGSSASAASIGSPGKERIQMSRKEPAEGVPENAEPDDVISAKEEAAVVLMPMKMGVAIYCPAREGLSVIAGASFGGRSQLVKTTVGGTVPSKELPMGLYSSDGKEFLKTPQVNSISLSWSKKYIAVGVADGSVIVRPTKFPETFVRMTSHSVGAGGVAFAAMSFDDNFVVSAGKDGSIVAHKLNNSLVEERAENLFKDVDAGVFEGNNVKRVTPTDSLDEMPSLSRVIIEEFQTSALEDMTPAEQQEEKPAEVTTTAVEPPQATSAKPSRGSSPSAIPMDELFPPFKLPSEEKLEEAAIAEVKPIVEAPDMTSTAYSIQDAKLKSEEDARRIAAEQLKDKVRLTVAALQRDFEELRSRSDGLPDFIRLSEDEIALDKDYFESLLRLGEEAIVEVHKECEFEVEKSARLRSKIATRLMDGMIVEEMPLYSFNKDNKRRRTVVRSLRTRGVEQNVKDLLASVQHMVLQGELEDAQQRANETAKQKALSVVTEMTGRAAKKEEEAVDKVDKDILGHGHGSTTGHHGPSSAAARRDLRKIRKGTLSMHEKQRPNEDDDDARDVKAIEFAEKNMGDYKLKCADDYEVPEEQRVNAAKKCRQMALLEESMVTMRLQFNERFVTLRQLKREIIATIHRDNKRIREIDEELGQPELSEGAALWEPVLDSEEFPDDRDEVTEGQLKEYMKARESKPWLAVKPPRQTIVTGTKTVVAKNTVNNTYDTRKKPMVGTLNENEKMPPVHSADNFLSEEKDIEDVLVGSASSASDAAAEYKVRDTVLNPFRVPGQVKVLKRIETLQSEIPILKFAAAAKKQKMFIENDCNRATMRQRASRRQRLEFERQQLLQKMEENVKEFDNAIDDLRVDRHAMIADLKMAELKLLVLFQELQLLQTFESRDISLQQKQLRCLGEKTEVQANTSENKAKLEGKLEELDVWTEKSAQITAELKSILPDNHPFVEILTKIFKKKIKRKKAGDDGEEDEMEEEEEDVDDEDEDEVDDSLPQNCDPVLYERVLDLREKRLDTEEISSEIQKNVDELKKALDRLRSREKQIIKDTQQAELEMQQFQSQKQAALNQIDVVVPLKLSQLHVFDTSGCLTVPSDQPTSAEAAETDLDLQVCIASLKDVSKRRVVADVGTKTHVLFSQKALKRLDDRISELHVEGSESRTSFQELHKQRVRLNKDRESKKEEIDEWKRRCEELQMLKFGRCIDLDELEADADRSKEEEAEMGVKEIEELYNRKSAELSKEIENLREELGNITSKNTELLKVVAELTESKLTITRELNSTDNSAPRPSRVDEYREREEQTRVASYVQLQAREIEALRIELFMLKRKDAATLAMPALPVPGPAGGSSSQLLGNGNSSSASQNPSFLPPIPGTLKK